MDEPFICIPVTRKEDPSINCLSKESPSLGFPESKAQDKNQEHCSYLEGQPMKVKGERGLGELEGKGEEQ